MQKKTAVVVIDMQAGLLKSHPAAYRLKEVVAAINHVTASAREKDVPVIFVQHDGEAGGGLDPFTPAWQLHEDLQRNDSDIPIRKTACDSFYLSPLKETLTRLGVKQIMVAGYATEFCVDTTVRSAASLGYSVTLLADAHTTKDRPIMKAEQIIAHHNWVLSNIAMPNNPISVANVDQLNWNGTT